MEENNLGSESPGNAVAISANGNTVGIGNKLVNDKTGRAAIYSKATIPPNKKKYKQYSKLILQLQTIGGSTIPFLCKQAARNINFTSCFQVLATNCPKTCGKRKE